LALVVLVDQVVTVEQEVEIWEQVLVVRVEELVFLELEV
jgi:hypothetical protein